MSGQKVILRVDATCPLDVEVGSAVREGQILQAAPGAAPVVAPLSGTVSRIDFDPGRHEFVIAIAPLSPH